MNPPFSLLPSVLRLPQLISFVLISVCADLLLALRPPLTYFHSFSLTLLLPFKLDEFVFFFSHFTFSSSLLPTIPPGKRGVRSVRAPWQHAKCRAKEGFNLLTQWIFEMNAGGGADAGGEARPRLLSFITIIHSYVHRHVCPPFHPSSVPLSVHRS